MIALFIIKSSDQDTNWFFVWVRILDHQIKTPIGFLCG